MTKKQKWLRLLAWLRREFPAQKPVKVRGKAMEDCAETRYERGHFNVSINSNKSYATMVDSAIHEWAHVLTWFGAGHEELHPEEWGVCYAKLYDAYDKWLPPGWTEEDKYG